MATIELMGKRENELKEALHREQMKVADLTHERDDWRDVYNAEVTDHRNTINRLKDQAVIAGVLAVGGRTSHLPGKAEVITPRRTVTATDQCSPRRD